MIVGVVMLLGVGACTESDTPSVELVQTYADVIIARQMIADSVQLRKTVDSILAAHHVDSAEFEASLREMSRTPQMFKSFYDSVSMQITRMRDSTGTK